MTTVSGESTGGITAESTIKIVLSADDLQSLQAGEELNLAVDWGAYDFGPGTKPAVPAPRKVTISAAT
jgi:hypothetical protein